MEKRPTANAEIFAAYRDMIAAGIKDRGYSFHDFLDEYYTPDGGEWRMIKTPPVRYNWTRSGKVRAALDFEKQKFGHVRQRDFWDAQLQTHAAAAQVTVIGLNMTPEKSRVYHGIQTLLEETSYLGTFKNADGTVNLPVRMWVTPAQWYVACGLERRKTKRGKKEFSGWEARDAMNALFNTADERVIFWKEHGKEIDVTPRAPFVVTRHYKNLTKDEAGGLLAAEMLRIAPEMNARELGEQITKSEPFAEQASNTTVSVHSPATATRPAMPLQKLMAVTIEPAPQLLEGIHDRFVLKSADYQTNIRQIAGKGTKSKYPVLLADLLYREAAQKLRVERAGGKRVRWDVRRRTLTLATELRMDARIKARQWSKIRDTFQRCAAILTQAGFLTGHEVEHKAEGETWVFRLNRKSYTDALDMERNKKELERQRKKRKPKAGPPGVQNMTAAELRESHPELWRTVDAYQSRNPNVSFATALRVVLNKRPPGE